MTNGKLSNNQRTAGKNFRDALARAGVTSADIMELTGASPQTVTNWKARGVSAQAAPVVAEALGVSVSEISLAQDEPFFTMRVKGHAPRVEVSDPPADPRLRRVLALLHRRAWSRADLALIEDLLVRLSEND